LDRRHGGDRTSDLRSVTDKFVAGTAFRNPKNAQTTSTPELLQVLHCFKFESQTITTLGAGFDSESQQRIARLDMCVHSLIRTGVGRRRLRDKGAERGFADLAETRDLSAERPDVLEKLVAKLQPPFNLAFWSMHHFVSVLIATAAAALVVAVWKRVCFESIPALKRVHV
jgi:hypothetical protein